VRIGSLFSGYGGLDMAVAQHYGATVAWHVEFDKHPSAVLDAHHLGVPNYGDVTAVDWAQVEPVDILTGGYPCQPFSHAGQRRGTNDERHLWPYVADALRVLRPRYAVFENVAGHLTLGFDTVLADLAALGFDAEWGVVSASDAGAPHRRQRLFVVAADAGGGQQSRTTVGADRLPVAGERGGDADGLTLLPTPKASDGPNGGPGMRNGRGVADALPGVVTQLLPTPTAQAAKYGSTPDIHANGYGSNLWDLPTLLSTPRATRGGSATETSYALGGEIDYSERPQGQVLLSTPTAGLGEGGGQRSHRWAEGSQRTHNPVELAHDLADGVMSDFGPYTAAIRRWEQVIGRAAPSPTEPGRDGRPRLSPRFVEWMMGLPDGWVTAVGIPRSAQLKALGNGVVPQQALLALALLDGNGAAVYADDVALLGTPNAHERTHTPRQVASGIQLANQIDELVNGQNR
jgi:DNA (cytosine-5)-methyltransferase 1